MKKKIIALIPCRLDSRRLFAKSLLSLDGLPLVVHTYRRARLSKMLDEVYICTDSKKIGKVALKHNCKVIYTGKNPTGTDRISEAAQKIKKKYDLYLDIQGDGNIKYYVRQDNTWRYDKSLSGLKPEQINFCNIKQNCFKIKETCTNLDSTKDMLKMNILEDIEKRFEEELIKTIQQLKGDLSLEFEYRKRNLQSLKQLKIYKTFIFNSIDSNTNKIKSY